MTYTHDSIKSAVEALRKNHLQKHKDKLKAAHAHEIVAAHFGFKSKIALKSSNYFELNPDDPETYEFPNSEEDIGYRLSKLKGLDVDPGFVKEAANIINSSIKPECSLCGCVDNSVKPAETDDNYPEQLWVCSRCVSVGEDVGNCIFCGDDMIYPVKMLNFSGECPEHEGESEMSPEDEEGWRHNMIKWSE